MNKEFAMAQTIYQEAKELSREIDDTKHYVLSLISEIHSRFWQNDPVTGKEKVKWSCLIEEGISLSEENETIEKNKDNLFVQLISNIKEIQEYLCHFRRYLAPVFIDILHVGVPPHAHQAKLKQYLKK